MKKNTKKTTKNNKKMIGGGRNKIENGKNKGIIKKFWTKLKKKFGKTKSSTPVQLNLNTSSVKRNPLFENNNNSNTPPDIQESHDWVDHKENILNNKPNNKPKFINSDGSIIEIKDPEIYTFKPESFETKNIKNQKYEKPLDQLVEDSIKFGDNNHYIITPNKGKTIGIRLELKRTLSIKDRKWNHPQPYYYENFIINITTTDEQIDIESEMELKALGHRQFLNLYINGHITNISNYQYSGNIIIIYNENDMINGSKPYITENLSDLSGRYH